MEKIHKCPICYIPSTISSVVETYLDNKDTEKLEQLRLLHEHRCKLLGIDITNPENKNTPLRCAKADLEQFTKPKLDFTIFENNQYDQLIIKPFVPFSSMCSHHLYNYFGVCHLGYLPSTKICGLSKLTRLVEYMSKGAHSQEWLTQKIASYLDEQLNPKGCIVVMRGRHTCESCRGVKNDNEDSVFITCAVTGCFKLNDNNIKDEFFNLIKI